MTDTKQVNISAQDGRTHVLSLVTKANKELGPVISSLILKSEEVDAGPNVVLNTLRHIFNPRDKDGNETDNLSDEFPRLNTSSIKGDDDFVETNEYTERFEASVTEPGKETKVKKLNFFTVFWSETDEGKAQAFVRAQIKMAGGDQRSKCEQKYREMDNIQLANLDEKMKKGQTRGRGLIRKAIGIWQATRDLQGIVGADDAPLVELLPSENSDTANTCPYDLVNQEKGGRVFKPMKVADILRLDPTAARAQGGSFYDALIAQLERGTGGAKSKYPVCENPEQIYDAAAAIVNGLDDNEDLQTALKEKMGKKKDGMMYITMLGTLRNALNGVWSKPLQVAYDRALDDKIAHQGDTARVEPREQAVA